MPLWLVLLLGAEALAAAVSGILWRDRVRPARDARGALGGGNRLVYTLDYGGLAIQPKQPNEGTRREGPTPDITEEP